MVRPSPVTRRPQIADALFYGAAADNGEPFSDPNVLTDGNLQWNVPTDDISVDLNSTGGECRSTGPGHGHQYWFPEVPQDDGHVHRLLPGERHRPDLRPAPGSGGLPTPDPQWPEGLPNVPQGGQLRG